MPTKFSLSFFSSFCRTFTIGANRAARWRYNKWNMLMPLLEHNNKHIAKIPNCKMRSSLRGSSPLPPLLPLPLLLLLLLCAERVLADTATATAATALSGGAAGGTGGGGGGGAPGALNANLTDLGSPGVYNSTNGLMLITC